MPQAFNGASMQYAHQLELKVRDYECDLQGVVNNAVYQNYLEHARHEFLRSRGIDFAAVTASGVNLVVIRAELDYRKSLVSGDHFCVRSRLRRSSKLRFEFQQAIYRTDDEALMLEASITATSLNPQGRPFLPEVLLGLLDDD